MDPRIGPLPAPQTAYLEPEYERLSREEIDALQLRLFRRDVERVWAGNPFYRERYEAAGITPDQIKTRDDFRRVPIVRKKDILEDQKVRPPYGRRLQAPLDEIVQVVESSGTSGLGKEVQALTGEDLDLIRRAKMFQFYWPGGRRGTVVALHIPITMAAGAMWSVDALRGLGCNSLRLGTLGVEERLGYMQRYSAEIIQASTSYITRLEHAAGELGLDLQKDFPRLRSIYVGGGGWTVAWAQERAELWNARLFEVYASSQRIFSYSCEWGIVRGQTRGILHFMEHLGLAELIDPATGNPVKHGEEGEVVITPFGMTASPLIRYGTGDRARFLEARDCPCGRRFNGIEAGSVGRYDDMLRIKEINIWPETIDDVIFSHGAATEYRGDLYVDDAGREVAKILVELRTDVDGAARKRICSELASAIHHRLGINFVVEEWTGESLTHGTTGIAPDMFKTRRRFNDRRTETRERRGAQSRS
jgi:phenylacetate-CoA ligase